MPDPANVSIPAQYFRLFPSLQTFDSLRSEENRQINEEIERIEAEENSTFQMLSESSSPIPMTMGDSGWWISRQRYTAPVN